MKNGSLKGSRTVHDQMPQWVRDSQSLIKDFPWIHPSENQSDLWLPSFDRIKTHLLQDLIQLCVSIRACVRQLDFHLHIRI
jgi:hypothetical protein